MVDSGLKRELAAGGYGQRVQLVKQAISKLRDAGLVKDGFVRHATESEILEVSPKAGLSVEQTSVLRHVVTENYRVHAMRTALEMGDADGVGSLLRLGHKSLSRDFGVSTEKLDSLVQYADGLEGVHGMRLTGAGMGGALVALVAREALPQVLPALAGFLKDRVSQDGAVYWIRAFADGVCSWKP